MPWYQNHAGESLWYEEQGSGNPVIFLHGWGMSSAVWRYQFRDLAASCRVIAPDLRGHGRSKTSATVYDFPAFAADLADLIAALDLNRPLLVGWSMGADIAMQAGCEIADRLSGLVLVSATPCFVARDDFTFGLTRKEADGMRHKVTRDSGRALDGFNRLLFADGELADFHRTEIYELLSEIEYPDTPILLEALHTLCQADMRPLLPAITAPVLILNGDRDRICLPHASRYMTEMIINARQLEFSGCGHAPFLSRPEQFNTEIVNFTRSCCREQA